MIWSEREECFPSSSPAQVCRLVLRRPCKGLEGRLLRLLGSLEEPRRGGAVGHAENF